MSTQKIEHVRTRTAVTAGSYGKSYKFTASLIDSLAVISDIEVILVKTNSQRILYRTLSIQVSIEKRTFSQFYCISSLHVLDCD